MVFPLQMNKALKAIAIIAFLGAASVMVLPFSVGQEASRTPEATFRWTLDLPMHDTVRHSLARVSACNEMERVAIGLHLPTEPQKKETPCSRKH